MTHIEELLALEPVAMRGRFLDIGAGRGEVLIDALARNINAWGIEINPKKIARIKEQVPHERIEEGSAEDLPYPDASYTFVNMCELIEHVANPEKVLHEANRVLVSGGKGYLSFPNRFAFYDTHYHIRFVNWLPRAWADGYIYLRGKAKVTNGIDLQRLSDMHYYTFSQLRRLAKRCGFSIEDARFRKLANRPMLRALYVLLRPWYFRSTHVIVTKTA